MKKIIVTLCLILFVTTLYLPAKKTVDTAAVDKIFAKWNKPGSPGCALAIVKDGKIVYKKGYGLANIELDVPITPQSVFYIGSVSKQFVAFSIALLESRGKLGFDDDIRKYVPEIPDYGATITIRHLIHHTSGIRGYLMLLDLAGLDFGHYHKAEDVINHIIAKQKNLNFKSGSKYQYSNSGYLILADIVRRVSGKSFRQFADENIFKPLGMKNSRFHDNYKELVKNRASGYFPQGKDGYKNFISSFDLVGSGGLFTTVEDLFLWDQNFYHHKAGGAELIKTIHTKGKLNNNKEIPYAFAMRHVNYKGLKTVGHTGALGGYRSIHLRFPGQNFSVICLANLSNFNTGRAAVQTADIFLADQFKPAPVEKEEKKEKKESEKKSSGTFVHLDRKDLENKTGAYLNKGTGELLKVTVRGGGLVAFDGRKNFVMAPLSKEKFKVVEPALDFMVTFKRENKKSPFTIHTVFNGKPWRVYDRVKAFSPSAEQLAEYSGVYYSEELNASYKVVVQDGKLFIKFRTAPDEPLKPALKDEFTLQGWKYGFSRENGKIISFNMSGPPISGIRFKKTK